jgi:hypothetical protein
MHRAKAKPLYPLIDRGKAFVRLRAPLFRPTYARANTPNFLQGARDTAACAPFFKERRMKSVEPTGPNRKFGAMGHPSMAHGVVWRTPNLNGNLIQ